MIVPGESDFTIYAGVDFNRVFQMLGSDGNPIDFTGYTPKLVAQINLGDSTTVLNYSGAPHLVFDGDWNLTLELKASDTATLTQCCLYYSIRMVNNSDATDILGYLYGVIEIVTLAGAGV